jgi:predicted permease
MSQIALLWVCLIAGIVLRVWNRLPSNAPATLNAFIFYISLPALIMVKFHEVQLTAEAVYPAMMPWFMFILSFLAFYPWGKLFRIEKKTVGALVLTAGLANTSFVGFPLIEAYYGKEGLKPAILLDQLGTFPVVSTLGIIIASIYSAKSLTFQRVAKQVFTFPTIYALGLALILRPVPFPEWVTDLLNRLGGTITPIALVSVGFQLKLKWPVLKARLLPLMLGLGFKLFAVPALLLVLYLFCFRYSGRDIQVVLTEAAMAPMITAAVVAAEYELDVELANLMVGVGIPLSFLTVPLWVHWLGSL